MLKKWFPGALSWKHHEVLAREWLICHFHHSMQPYQLCPRLAHIKIKLYG